MRYWYIPRFDLNSDKHNTNGSIVTYTEDELEWLRQAEEEYEDSYNNEIKQRFGYVTFVSKSKGRGRKRKHWKEVELFRDYYGREGWHERLRGADEIATEVYQRDGTHIDEELLNDIREHCKR